MSEDTVPSHFNKEVHPGSFIAFQESLNEIILKHGPDSVIGFISPYVSNESAYLFQKFMRPCVGTNNIIGGAGPELSWDPFRTIHNALGTVSLTPSIKSIEHADCILILQGGLIDSNQELIRHIKNCRENRKAEIILIGTGKSPIDEFQPIRIPAPPEAEAELLRSFLWVANLRGGVDREVVWKDNDGFQKLVKQLKNYEPSAIAQKWNINYEDVEKAALLITQKRSLSVIISSREYPDYQLCRCCEDALNLILATGNIGAPGRGLYYIPGNLNSLGLMMMGCSPNYLPGFAPLINESAKDWFSTCWGKDLSDNSGIHLDQALTLMDEKAFKCLIYMGGSPTDYVYNPAAFDAKLSNIDLIAGAGFNFDPKCRFWWPLKNIESHAGTYVTYDKQLKFHRGASVDGDNLFNDWEIVTHWLDYFQKSASSPTFDSIFNEITESIPSLLGVDKEKIQEEEITLLPFLAETEGTMDEAFSVKDLPHIRFENIPPPSTPMKPPEFPLILHSIDEQTLSESTEKNLEDADVILVGLHPNDAACLKIPDREFVILDNQKTSVTGYTKLSVDVPEGCLVAWIRSNAQSYLLAPFRREFVRVNLKLVKRS